MLNLHLVNTNVFVPPKKELYSTNEIPKLFLTKELFKKMFTLRKIMNSSLTFFVTKRLCEDGMDCEAFCYSGYRIVYSKYNHQIKDYSEII